MRRSRAMMAMAALAGLPGIAEAADEPQPATVFINYEGGVLTAGGDPSLDQLECLDGEVHYPAFFGSRTLADQITEQVRAVMSPFAVRVVDERPPSHLSYTMVMVGGLPQALGFDAGVGGYACIIDCGDSDPEQTVLVFGGEIRDATELAQTVVHEVAHSWGLDHVAASDFIMNGTTSGSERTLADGCMPLEEPDKASCKEQHQVLCDEPDTQHSVAELMELRGPAAPDVVPPQVVLRSPVDGQQVAPGDAVVVEVEVGDDQPAYGWRFVVPELSWAERSEGRSSMELRFPAGEYTVRVEATDQAGNEAADEVTIVVGEPMEDEDEPQSSEDDGLDEPEAELAGGDGGGCRMSPRGPTGLSLLVWMLGLRRRRRWSRGGAGVPSARGV